MDELRVNVEDVQVTAACYQESAGRLVGGAPAGAGPTFQPSAAAVQAVHASAETTRAALSARTAATGVAVAAADAGYVENEARSAARLHTMGSQVV